MEPDSASEDRSPKPPSEPKHRAHSGCDVDQPLETAPSSAPVGQTHIDSPQENSQRFPDQSSGVHPQENILQEHILNALEDVVWSASLTEDRYLFFSQAAERVYGYPAKSFMEDMSLWLRVIHPEDRLRIEAVHQDIRETGYQDLEYRIFRADGALRWVRDRAYLIVDEAGLPTRIDGILTDITERKQIEEERQQIEAELRQRVVQERFLSAIAQRIYQSLDLNDVLGIAVSEMRHLLKADRVLISAFQPDGSSQIVMESVLPSWPSLLGLQSQDVALVEPYREHYARKTITAIADVSKAALSPQHLEHLSAFQVKACLVAPIGQGEKFWGLLIVHQCSGKRYWQSAEVDLAQRLSTKLGIAIHQAELFQQVQHLNATLESQVDERTRQLQELLTFESLLKRIIDKVRNSLDERQILQTVVQELAIHLNLDACDCAIYDLEQQTSTISYEHVCRGPTLLGTVWQMSNFPEFYEQLQRDDVCFQFCARHQKRAWVAIMACPVRDNLKVLGDLWLVRSKEQWFSESETRLIQQVVNQCAIAIRQARLYYEVQRQVEGLERLNQLKDDFLSTVSHELRTPVASIKMASQMLEVTLMKQSLLTPEDTPLARYLRVLQDECDREIRLVNDLLDLSRLEAESVPLFLNTVPLQVWLPHLTEPFLPRIQQHQQHLTVSIAEDLPNIVSDTALLERVLIELLNNACKYTPPGEQIELRAWSEATAVYIEIRNSGVEIPAEARSHIFDKFYRVPNADPWKHGGTGLGLALVKRIMAELQGSITLTSTACCTAFTLSLPLALEP